MNNIDDKERINDLVATLDNLVSSGTQHINVNVLTNNLEKSVETTNACCSVNSACAQPTENVDED